MTAKIGVVGSINLDLVASGAPLPRAGETVTGARFAQYPGGKGANQALAARRLGADVQLIGCVGDDGFAEPALSLLRRDGVDLGHVMSEVGETTGLALISVAPDGENQITVASGANARVGASDVAALSACQVILSQLEVPVVAVEAAIEVAHQSGALMAINLAPAKPLPSAMLEPVDVLIMNELEAEFYADALPSVSGMCVLTRGAAGARITQRGAVIAEVEAFSVDAVDATGAGDTFCGALCVALAEGQSPQAALRFANAAAALSVTRAGAQPSLPWRPDVEALLGSHD